MITLTDVCGELRNWFDTRRYFNKFTIKDDEITINDGEMRLNDLYPNALQDGQYFRIVGSVFNDGVYQYPPSELTEETFEGAVWAMAVPREVTNLLLDINMWNDKYATALQTPYSSESFGGYSYSLKGSLSDTEAAEPWKAEFGARLNRWRKI